MKTDIKKMGINGEGIGYFKKKPVFLPGCFPNETVEFNITETNEKYLRGTVVKVISKSDDRVVSSCRHASQCGSCPLMSLNYDAQLRHKKELLKEALEKYSGYSGKINNVVSTDQYYYRNKINLPVLSDEKGKLYNAIYESNSNKPVKINECMIHDKKLEKIRFKVLKVLNRFHYAAYNKKTKSGLRQLVIRGFDEYQVTLVTGNDTVKKEILDELMSIKGIVSIYQSINTQKNPVSLLNEEFKLLAGKEMINLKVCGKKLQLHPKAFFQLNLKQAENIYNKVNQMIPKGTRTVVEAYCGIGAMSLMAANKAQEVIGIELDKSAVASAKENAKINGIKNVSFRCGDAGKEIVKLTKKKKIDVLIVDPPRTGLDEVFVKCLKTADIDKIIYVSCNPATLAKNIKSLERRYRVEEVTPYDMFPNTPHVETICCLYHQKKGFISVPYEPKNVE